jgi:hypothetical protein
MTLSDANSNHEAIARLKSWLASDPEIPRFRRRANRAAICRQAGIARSTADANPEIRALIAGLDMKVIKAQRTAAKCTADPKILSLEVADPLLLECGWPTRARSDSLALEHLLQTGRVVR